MPLWNEADFQRVALATKLGKRTLEACRDVLVSGMPGVEAAQRWKLLPPQISRGVNTLKSKQTQMLESADSLKVDSNLLKYTAIQIAKLMMGERFNVVDAVPGKVYEGPIILNSHGYLVQKIGAVGVAHDLGNFQQAPQLNSPVSIGYTNEGMSPLVTSINVGDHYNFGRRAEDRGVGR